MLAMKLHEKLRRLCGQRGWGQSSLLEVVPHVTKSSMSNWWSGKYRPDLESALLIARALAVPLDYLADDAQDDPPAIEELPEDEAAVLRVYRNLKRAGALNEASATHGLALAASSTAPSRIAPGSTTTLDDEDLPPAGFEKSPGSHASGRGTPRAKHSG